MDVILCTSLSEHYIKYSWRSRKQQAVGFAATSRARMHLNGQFRSECSRPNCRHLKKYFSEYKAAKYVFWQFTLANWAFLRVYLHFRGVGVPALPVTPHDGLATDDGCQSVVEGVVPCSTKKLQEIDSFRALV